MTQQPESKSPPNYRLSQGQCFTCFFKKVIFQLPKDHELRCEVYDKAVEPDHVCDEYK